MGDKFTTSGFATRGEFVTHSWEYFATRGGIEDVPFVTHRGFSIHRLGASPLVGELPRPYFFSIRDSAILLLFLPLELCKLQLHMIFMRM